MHGTFGMKRLWLRFICLCVFCLTPVAFVAQSPPLRTLLVGVDHRMTTSLDGPWHYLVDQSPAKGLYNDRGEVRDSGYAQNTHPNISSGPHNDEYDFATAPTMHVPGDWNTQDPTLFRYEGVVWFERNFEYQPVANTRTFLHLGAANYLSHVWVNGKRLCDHEGGFTPFDCEATSLLHAGTNAVVIAVDSTRHQDDLPSVSYDWFNYGGITRDVSLVRLPMQFIDDYDVHLDRKAHFSALDARGISGYVHVEGALSGRPVEVSVPEAGVDVTVRTDANGRAEFHAQANTLQLWGPGHPKLYKVALSSGEDRVVDDIGFRDVRVDGLNILLNGEPVFLRGVNVHAEAPVRTGRANTDADVATIFDYLRDLDANFVRLAHYPHDERMERMADRSGVMVWSEIPLWQQISWDKPEVYAKASAVLAEMIRRDRNKASVILWSVSNETSRSPARTQFLTGLVSQARMLDSTRLITSALFAPRMNGTRLVQDDPLANVLDVVGQNEYIGWYGGKPEEAETAEWTLPQKPVILSEFGAEAKYGNHGSPTDRWTEEQQANVYKHQFVMIGKIPQVCGMAPWVLTDFRSPGRNIPKLQDGFNRKGLISEDGHKKQAFFVLKHYYEDRAASISP